MDKSSDNREDESRAIGKRIGSLALVLLIVTSTIGSPLLVPYLGSDGIETADISPTQTAAAQETSSPQLVCDLNIYLSADGICDVNFDPTVEQDLDHMQAYQKGLSKIAAKETTLQIIDNYAGDTEDIAFLIAEREIYKSLNEGDSQSVAQSKAQVAVQEYYQQKKFNYLDFWNQYVTGLENIDSTADAAAYRPNLWAKSSNSFSATNKDAGIHESEITFDKINETITVKSPKQTGDIYYHDPDRTAEWWWNPADGLEIMDFGSGYISKDGTVQANIEPPSTDDGPQKAYLFEDQWNGYDTLEQKETDVVNQMNTYVENTYSEFQNDDSLNSSDVLSQVNILNNLLAETDVENGTFDEIKTYLAATGMSTADGDFAFMDIRYRPYSDDGQSLRSNRTIEGILGSTSEPPSGEWQTGTAYDTEQLDGSQSVAKLSGGLQTLNGEFEIRKLVNEEGNEVSGQITTDDRDYSVSNTTELQQRTMELQDEIDRLQDLRSNDTYVIGGASSSGPGFWERLFSGLSLDAPFGGGSPIPTLPGFGVIESIVIVFLGLFGLSILRG